MSDTPETDHCISERRRIHNLNGFVVLELVNANLARKLERERDEAREQLADWENAAAHFEADRAALHDLVRQAGEEYFRKWPADKDRIGQRLAFQDAVMQEVDLRTLDFERMKQERDEAREKLRKTRKFLEDANRGAETNAKIIQVQLAKISRLRRESEEAREALEYIAHAGLSSRHIEDYAKEFLRRKEDAK